MKEFKLLMLSAMYENGGNVTHRLLDGHPDFFVYPFESQTGTNFVNDHLSGMIQNKYRLGVFPSHFTAEQIYTAIIDQECKVRARTPQVSKFRNTDFHFSDDERMLHFIELLGNPPYSRAHIYEAFFKATFFSWKNYKSSETEKCYVGYSPAIVVDGEQIINEYSGKASILHVVRNPFSAYADTLHRPVPLSLDHYINAWVTCQYYALWLQKKYPDNCVIIRYEDLLTNPAGTLADTIKEIGYSGFHTALAYPSWNGQPLIQVNPWGTIQLPTIETNEASARSLPESKAREIYWRTQHYLELFRYNNFARMARDK